MLFIFIVSLVLLTISFVVVFLIQGGWSRQRRRADRFWRRLLVRQLLLVPVYVFVLIPGLMGLAGSRWIRTRHDEAGYLGPILAANGAWEIQTRATLRAADSLTEAELAAIHDRVVRIPSSDGRQLRGFYVPCRNGKPKVMAVLVHGLFRNAMEVETVGAMFRDFGADVLLVELSNHGGSDRHPFTYGFTEYRDVLAAVDFLRTRKNDPGVPLVLFGVSLGGVAVARAAPEIPELAGLVLDAPMTDLGDTVDRQMGNAAAQGRVGFGFPSWFVAAVKWHIEFWSDFDMDDVRPVEHLARLSPRLNALFIGAGLDGRVPPDVVRAAYAALPAAEGTKELWIEPDSNHGKVWLDQPEEYRRRVHAFLERVTSG